MEAELAAKSERLAALDSQLHMDNKPDMEARASPPACNDYRQFCNGRDIESEL